MSVLLHDSHPRSQLAGLPQLPADSGEQGKMTEAADQRVLKPGPVGRTRAGRERLRRIIKLTRGQPGGALARLDQDLELGMLLEPLVHLHLQETFRG